MLHPSPTESMLPATIMSGEGQDQSRVKSKTKTRSAIAGNHENDEKQDAQQQQRAVKFPEWDDSDDSEDLDKKWGTAFKDRLLVTPLRNCVEFTCPIDDESLLLPSLSTLKTSLLFSTQDTGGDGRLWWWTHRLHTSSPYMVFCFDLQRQLQRLYNSMQWKRHRSLLADVFKARACEVCDGYVYVGWFID